MVASVRSGGITVASPARMGAMTATKTIVGSAGGLETGSRGAGFQTMGREKGFSSQRFAAFNTPTRVFGEHGQRANVAMTPSIRAKEASPLITIPTSKDKRVANISRVHKPESLFVRPSENLGKARVAPDNKLTAIQRIHARTENFGIKPIEQPIKKVAPIRQEGLMFYIGRPEARPNKPGIDTKDALRNLQVIAKNKPSSVILGRTEGRPTANLEHVKGGDSGGRRASVSTLPESSRISSNVESPLRYPHTSTENKQVIQSTRPEPYVPHIARRSPMVESPYARKERIAKLSSKRVTIDTTPVVQTLSNKQVDSSTSEVRTAPTTLNKSRVEQGNKLSNQERIEKVIPQVHKDQAVQQRIREKILAIMSQEQEKQKREPKTSGSRERDKVQVVLKSLENYTQLPKEQRILTPDVILGFAEKVKATSTPEQVGYIMSLAHSTKLRGTETVALYQADESEVQKQLKQKLAQLLQNRPEVQEKLMGELKQVIQTYISATSVESMAQSSVTTLIIRQVITHFERRVVKELQEVEPAVVRQLQVEKTPAPTVLEVHPEIKEDEEVSEVSKKEKKEKTPEFVEAEREMAARKKQIIGLALMKAVPESADLIVHGDEVIKDVIQTVDVTSPIIKDHLSKDQTPDGAFEDSIKEIEKISGPIPYFILESNKVINRNPSVDVSESGKVVSIEDVRRVHKKISTHTFYENAWKQIAA